MNEFDKYIRRKAKEEQKDVPNNVLVKVEDALSSLPENRSMSGRIRQFPKIAIIAACLAFVCFIILPNCSNVYAQALEKIPVIGSIIKVTTIRNYFYSDDYHEMEISVPEIENEDSEAIDYINKDVDELTKILAEQFDKDLSEIGNNGHSSVYVDYEVVTNTEKWFTLKIRVNEVAGSGNVYYKYYHIDKTNGKIMNLGDLSSNNDFCTILENEIRRQMREIMAKDSDKVYWVDDAFEGQDFVKLDEKHNFYWDENGDLVIVFDKYEVAPGSMGTPEFTIPKDVIKDVLKQGI